MADLITLATCSLNQWVLDWEGNLRRIRKSIILAKEAGATLRTGPELEITGYGCLDHFLEADVYEHSLESLLAILTDTELHGILIDVGLPLMHRGCRYNCRAIILDGKLLCLRPKIYLANDGNFRENRFFTPWNRPRYVEKYNLPPALQKHQGVRQVPIGDVVLSLNDTTVAAETCEELFTPQAPHINMALNGVEIFTNSSGSHHTLRKLDERIALISEATRKSGGVYLYANQSGSDGDRLLYDGASLIMVNGSIVAQGSQFSLDDVEVVTATVDLEEVRAYRFAPSRNFQAVQAPVYERIEVDFSLGHEDLDLLRAPTAPRPARYHVPEEEIALGPACWLWDYLRRSRASGYLVPLSGGIDSCATATIVFSMCRLVVEAIKAGNEEVIEDVKRIAVFSDKLPETAEEFCNQIFHTVYMGMEKQSSKETRQRAKDLAERIGSYHTDMNIDDTFHATKNLLTQGTGFEPKFKVHGGSATENLALQNIQARSRMVIAYYYAQMLPTVRQRPALDRLASTAVQFDSAYCPSPLCAPSRMSLISGQLPMKIGAYDNAAQIGSDVPTYAHYLRSKGYHTALAGKMHFIGDQLHGYEQRLTSDIYPGDFGWAVNWDEPDTRLEWYHNASSILQAGPCGRSNQLDYDEEVMFKSTQYLWDHVREGPKKRPFALTVSLTHPHDPYTITKKYWNLYEDVDIALPEVKMNKEDLDAHSQRLLKVCDLWDQDFSEEQIKRAKRAYYGSVSYVDDCIGRLLETLEDAGLAENTIVIFSGDHGDMLGERGLWYKMSYFESSVRVPMLINYPKRFTPHRVTQNVSTLDLLPTICDLVGTKPSPYLPMDGISMLPHLEGREGHDTVIAEYTGEGTVRPMMMIRRGDWKYITCPADEPQLYNLARDPKELDNLARFRKIAPQTAEQEEAKEVFHKFEAEAHARWDFDEITEKVLLSQRTRRVVWDALKEGEFTSWDFNPDDDGRKKYIRSTIPLDDLERRARYPFVDANGYESKAVSHVRNS